tara:strand:- start:112 stop:375 length:264 start_codon:yes stop_codon:yes gene_type:complete
MSKEFAKHQKKNARQFRAVEKIHQDVSKALRALSSARALYDVYHDWHKSEVGTYCAEQGNNYMLLALERLRHAVYLLERSDREQSDG